MTRFLPPFSSQALSIKPGAIYEHYKGKLYQIIGVGRHTETLEEYVVYTTYGDPDIWLRPLTMFLEDVVIEGQAMPRFKYKKTNA